MKIGLYLDELVILFFEGCPSLLFFASSFRTRSGEGISIPLRIRECARIQAKI